MVKSRLLIDSDVMIEYLRGAAEAITFLESLERRPATSVICVAELIAGARNEEERDSIRQFLLAFDELPVDGQIARVGGAYRQAYIRSYNVGLADALIAATAKLHGLVLATFNAKHFPMLKDTDVVAPYQRGA
jgi:hypothetical protein